jgi:hypothetical protein
MMGCGRGSVHSHRLSFVRRRADAPEELARLRKENRQLRVEHEIPRRDAAFFAKRTIAEKSGLDPTSWHVACKPMGSAGEIY